MAKRRRGTKSSDLLVLLWTAALACLGYPPRGHPVAWIILVPAVALLWIAFLMPTKCDYIGQRGKRCDRGVRGKLRGCRDHARWRRDAMFAVLGAGNPGRHASRPDPNVQSGVHSVEHERKQRG